MRILLLSRYDRLGASSRYRLLQFLPYFEAQGLSVTKIPLLDDNYIAEIYAKKKITWSRILLSYAKRIWTLIHLARKYDVLWIEKELFPGLPAWGEWCLSLFGMPYVVDYDDAIFHNYEMHPNKMYRAVLKNKIDSVMKYATSVIAGNDYLCGRARRAGAKDVTLLPTVIDLQRYSLSFPANNNEFIIGWIGSPGNSRYLQLIQPALKTICSDGRTRILLIGSGNVNLPDIPIEIREWSENTEIQDLQSIDVGIMPLPDLPFERGKCGLKLIQYMACGRPIIGSPVGVNNSIIQQGINGFLASTVEEWIEALTALRDDVQLRKKMGIAGRVMVEQNYCIQVVAPNLIRLIEECGTKNSTRY